MIKAIFFDLDGTLLDSRKQIPASAVQALAECRNKGIKLFLATARTPLLEKMLNWTPAEMDLFDGGIYCNGACEKLDGVTRYYDIPPDVVQYSIGQAARYDKLNIALQMRNEIHAFNHPLDQSAYDAWGIADQDIVSLDKARLDGTVKILIYFENLIDTVTALPHDLTRAMETYCSDKARCYLTDNGKVLQIINHSVSKYKSVENIRIRLKLEKDEIAVFGDDRNDMEMLGGYKNAIAMGNAAADIKQAAGMVTKSNDEDGIAFAISELLPIG